MAPQAAIGVVGNPTLSPAFRVRRGSGRENGFATSRARRATRPTPERISVPCGHGADISSRRVCWGITHRPLSPCTLPPRCRSRVRAWEPARESGGDADRIDRKGGRARGATESSADAREGMARSTERIPAPTSASVSRPLNRGRSSTAGEPVLTSSASNVRGGGSAQTERATLADPTVNGEVAPIPAIGPAPIKLVKPTKAIPHARASG